MPEFKQPVPAAISDALIFSESFTSVYVMARVLVGLTNHLVPLEVLTMNTGLAAVPVSVHVPLMIWVLPAVNFNILPAVVQVKLLKVLLPEMVAACGPLKVTVPVLMVNVPPALAQSPVTLIAVAVPGVNVPLVRVRLLIFNVVVLPPMLKALVAFTISILYRVCVAAVPLIAWSAKVLVNLNVPIPPVNVPLLVQLPERVIV